MTTAGAYLQGAGNIRTMKTTLTFRDRAAANSFAQRLKDITKKALYSQVYVMHNRYACTVSGDFTEEQVLKAKTAHA